MKLIQSKRDVGFWMAIWVLLIVNLFAIRSWYHAVSGSEVVRRFTTIWYYSPHTWPYNRWLGVKTLQNPNDVWIIQEIIAEVKPDFVIETGTLRGGSAALWAMILEQVNPEGRVITVDIEDKRAKKLPPIAAEKVDFLIGSSTNPGIVAEIARRVRGKKVVVILDSAHSKNHVLAELRAYAPMVPKASYLIVQDSNVNGHPTWPDYGPGPFEAIEEFLVENDEFRVDKTPRTAALHDAPQRLPSAGSTAARGAASRWFLRRLESRLRPLPDFDHRDTAGQFVLQQWSCGAASLPRSTVSPRGSESTCGQRTLRCPASFSNPWSATVSRDPRTREVKP